jgi:hypothetical protein
VIERPARGLKTKKPSDPDKTENEGIHGSRPALTEQAGLILLFDGEVDSAWAESRRAQPNRYPDFGLKTSLPPSRPGGQWHWESVTRYSGATVPDFHGVP